MKDRRAGTGGGWDMGRGGELWHCGKREGVFMHNNRIWIHAENNSKYNVSLKVCENIYENEKKKS